MLGQMRVKCKGQFPITLVGDYPAKPCKACTAVWSVNSKRKGLKVMCPAFKKA